MATREVDFLFDYASPWAFLANAVLDRKLPGVPIAYRPVYLRGFPAFAGGIPYSAEKLAYIVRDFERCAAYEEVRVVMPSAYPINGIHALRGAIVADAEGRFAEYHAALFRAAWQEDRDVSKKELVIALGREAGALAIAEGIEDPAVKEALRAETTRAQARGAFGVPSFFVGDELFWGHDRMDYVARAAATSSAAGQ